jgi:hypothetical protein
MTRHALRSLILDVLREGIDTPPPSGMADRARELGRKSDLSTKMMHLNMDLRHLYIDALDAHESGDSDAYRSIMGRISELEWKLADLKAQHDDVETDT